MSCDPHGEMLAAFPYPPYEIQQQLMINIYEALHNKQIGMFESPTGTGKTLSVICSTLKWLEDERTAQAQEAAKGSDDGADLPDWMRNFSNTSASVSSQQAAHATANQQPTRKEQDNKQNKQQQCQILDDDGQDLSEFLIAADGSAGRSIGRKRQATESGYVSSSSEEDDTEAAADPEGAAAAAAAARKRPQVIFCSRTHSQLSQFVGELHRTRFADSVMIVAVGSRKNLCVNDEVLRLQELSQINERCLELQRNKASSSSRKAAAADATAAAGSTSSQGVVSFMQQQQQQQRALSARGSKPARQRKTLTAKKAGCPFLAVEGGAAAWDEFTDLMLAAPIDVEELANLGRKKKVCPYYGSRRAAPSADVILAPYSSVLLPDARQSLGIQLAGSVVVFDEAHNLLDAINGAHSTAVSAWQLLSVQRSFTAYYERFKAFLNPANAQNLQLLLRTAAALHACLTQQQQQQGGYRGSSSRQSGVSAAGRVVAVNDLLFDTGLDNVNMLQLARWVRDTKLAFKVSGHTAVAVERAGGTVALQQINQAAAANPSPAAAGQDDEQAVHGAAAVQQQQQLGHLSARDGVTAIHSFISFLCSLTNSDMDGRVIIEPAVAAAAAAEGAAAAVGETSISSSSNPSAAAAAAGRGGRLRYVLLNAASHFGQLLADARSVLLVSGTLAPVDGLKAQLFPSIAPERLRHFECGHVVPANQLLALAIGSGPSGRALNLRHESRSDQGLVDELGQLLLNLAAVVPEGCVVFAPSFSYLELLMARWQASGLLAKLQQRKQVFREPRSATDVEQVLAAYTAAVANNTSGSSSTAQQPPQAAAAAGAGCAASQQANIGDGDNNSSSSSSSGGVMFCVVGGKLSEGINFGDGLGRCVVMLGMPYPNPSDPELRERMAYLDKQAAAAGTTSATTMPAVRQQQQQGAEQALQQAQQQLEQQQQQQRQQSNVQHRSVFQVVNAGPHATVQAVSASKAEQLQAPAQPAATGAEADAASPLTASSTAESQQQQQEPQQQRRSLAGRDYYDDLCFKAVNQCVGRVVRHKGDYAAIVMVDSRWVASPAEWATITQQQRQGTSSSTSSNGRQLPVQKLPGWVQRSYVATNGQFGQAYKELAHFFSRHRQQQQQQQLA